MNTIPRDTSNIIVIGNWGAGKTRFFGALTPLIAGEKGIKSIHFDSDRFAFEDAVRSDTDGFSREPDGSIIGPHSILVKDGSKGHMDFRALDGLIFNEAHRRMLSQLARHEPGVLRLVEYASGPSTSFQQGELLDQSGHFVVKTLIESGAIRNTFVIELEAPFELRKIRNKTREDPVDPIAFELYGQPGGDMTMDDSAALGEHFLHVQNRTPGIETLVSRVFYEHLKHRLLLDGHVPSIEGTTSALRRSRR
jgi:hypothetical protein